MYLKEIYPYRPSQPINSDRYNQPKQHVTKPRRRKLGIVIRTQAKTHLRLFLENASIHGLNHLVAVRRHYFEILFWLIIIVLSASGSLYLSSLTWNRYQSSPTVISMDKDMFAWNTSFPAVTICSETIHNIDYEKLATYLSESRESNKTKLKNFILKLANATYNTFEDVPNYPDIHPDDYLALLLNISLPLKPRFAGSLKMTEAMPTVTEMGICYAVNSRTAVYNSPKYLAANRWDIIHNDNESAYAHPLDGEVFVKLSTNRDHKFTVNTVYFLHSMALGAKPADRLVMMKDYHCPWTPAMQEF